MVLHSLQSELQSNTQLSALVIQVAHLELSQSKQEPFFKYLPLLQEIHFLVELHYLQSELHLSLQLVELVIHVAH